RAWWLRDRRAARPDEIEGPDHRPAPAVPHRQGSGEARARPGPRQEPVRPTPGYRGSRRQARHRPRDGRRPAGSMRADGLPRVTPSSAGPPLRLGPTIRAIDLHACGEPGRVIVGGVEGIPGGSMFEAMTWL